jgi:hypothetical protein
MAKVSPDSSWNLPPTDAQVRRIAQYCIWNHIRESLEERPSNRREARNLIFALRKEKRRRRR